MPTAAGSPAVARRGWRPGPALGARRGRLGRGRREPGATRSARELAEEWSVSPERLTVEALIRLPTRITMLARAGVAARPARRSPPMPSTTSSRGGPPIRRQWPEQADAPLRRTGCAAQLLSEMRRTRPWPRHLPPAGGRPRSSTRPSIWRCSSARSRSAGPQPETFCARASPTACSGSACRWSASPPPARGSSPSGSRSRSRCSAGSGRSRAADRVPVMQTDAVSARAARRAQ